MNAASAGSMRRDAVAYAHGVRECLGGLVV